METRIDKIIISNVIIKDILNVNYLIEREIVEEYSCGAYYLTESNQLIKSMNIKDEQITNLTAGGKILRNINKRYCHITLTVKDEHKCNLNCRTVKELMAHLENIKIHLYSKYGVVADFSQAQIKEIELNKTIELKESFESYWRVLQLIFSNLPTRYKNEHEWHSLTDSKQITGMSATTKKSEKSKSYQMLTIYNKRKQLEQKITLEKELMRVEMRLIGVTSIQHALQIKSIEQLQQQKVDNYFEYQILKIIVKPYKLWRARQQKEIVKIIKTMSNQKRWIISTLRYISNQEIESKVPFALDIQQIIEAYQTTTKECSSRVNSIVFQFEKQAQKYENYLTTNDSEKMNEIINKLIIKI